MNQLKSALMVGRKFVHDNAPTIIAGIGISGTITTAVLAADAGFKSAKRLSEKSPKNTPREIFEETWDLYVPAVLSGAATIGCIVLSNRLNSKRAAAAYSLLAVSERAFEEYRDKVVSVIGEKKEQKLKDDIAQERVDKKPAPSVIVAGDGSVICCELFTGRYFKSDMETLRKAQNDINARIMQELYVCLDEFYYLIDLDPTSSSGHCGWDSARLMELDFSTVLTSDGKPCLAFNYNYIKNI